MAALLCSLESGIVGFLLGAILTLGFVTLTLGGKK